MDNLDPTKAPLETLSFEGGKYELRRIGYVITAYRYGEPWRDFTGDKFIALLADLAFKNQHG